MHPRHSVIFCIATIGLGLLTGHADEPGVVIDREADRTTRLTISTGKGQFAVKRNLWSNTNVVTESGKTLSLTDPLMYSAHAVLSDGTKTGGYWTKPEVFDLWQVSEIVDAGRPESIVAKIVAEPPGLGLRKEVTIAVDSGENIAYVYNRLTATEDLILQGDRQCIYLSSPKDNYTIWADGRELTPSDGAGAAMHRTLVFQHKKTGASAGIVFLDRSVQRYPNADRAPFGAVHFYDNEKANGADCSWEKGGGSMIAGDFRVQQYAILWGDGDLREKAEALSKKALAGELNPRVYALASPKLPADLLLSSDELCVDELDYGAWTPLRTQPTISPGTHQHSTYLSPYNAITARKIIANYADKKPMLLVRGPFGRAVFGRQDGLLHGMRPRVLAESFQGSYLREYARGWDPVGEMSVVSADAAKVELNWQSARSSRRITAWSTGIIESEWTNGPRDVSLFVGCHPYHYLSADGEGAVRFSQLIQRRRDLPDASRLAMFGYRDAALEVRARDATTRAEEVWLDSGEVGWEWVMDFASKNPDEKSRVHVPFANWVRRNAALTYLAGGALRKVDLSAATGDWAIDYRISDDGAQVMQSLQQAGFTPPPPEPPIDPPAVSVRAESTTLRTTRIWPNDLHGWKLRPLKLVHTNPMPATFTLEIVSADARTVQFDLDKESWLASAMVESDPEAFQISGSQAPAVDRYRQQAFWQDAPPSVAIKAGAPKTVLLRLHARGDTLGEYDTVLRWRSGPDQGSIPLRLKVVPSSLVDPYGEPLAGAEDQKRFGHTGGAMHPTYLRWYYAAGTPEEEDEYLRLMGEHGLRNSSWIRDVGFLRNYITACTQDGAGASGRQKEYFSLPPDEYVKRLRRDTVMRSARFPYRYRVYLADEIWEILGGYKGRRYMPVEDVARWVENLIADCPNPCWFSLMQPAIDDEYQTRLPNDISEVFYYCGRDEAFRAYVHKLVKPRLELVETWKRSPELLERAGTDDVRPMFSFWVSGQLHVTDYSSMRRQHWYARFNGIDIIMFWVFRANGMIYADRIGCNSVLGSGEGQVLMTDRSLAWHDLCEDMAWISLVRLLKQSASPDVQARVAALEARAAEASQRSEFDQARDFLAQAVRLMAPEHAELVGPHFYSPVASEPLSDLHAGDAELSDRPKRKRATVRKLQGGRRPAPTLNATLDNSYLEDGALLDGFLLLTTHQKPEAKTAVHLAWDDDNLYALFTCAEPQADKLVADPNLARDGAVYTTDCVELFVDRSGGGNTWMQFIVGAGGTIYDARAVLKEEGDVTLLSEEVEEWDPHYTWETRRDGNGWVAEIHIPWEALGGPPEPGAVWRMNFARERQPSPELSIWSPQEGGFREPEQFGEVQFVR